MIADIKAASSRTDLEPNHNKTKYMSNPTDDTGLIAIDKDNIELISLFTYLRQTLTLEEENQE